jgi:hypothetical protein
MVMIMFRRFTRVNLLAKSGFYEEENGSRKEAHGSRCPNFMPVLRRVAGSFTSCKIGWKAKHPIQKPLPSNPALPCMSRVWRREGGMAGADRLSPLTG